MQGEGRCGVLDREEEHTLALGCQGQVLLDEDNVSSSFPKTSQWPSMGIAGFGNVLMCTWLPQGQVCVQVCRTFSAMPTHSITVLAGRWKGRRATYMSGEGQETSSPFMARWP